MILFDRQTYFNAVRASLFNGSLTQQQVDGQEFKLAAYEAKPFSADLRHLAYAFATSFHETARKMWPIEEYGKGKDRPYGKQDPETKQTYYGRGDVQLTWRENYARATRKLDLTGGTDDLEWHAERALDPTLSAEIMYSGMSEGWFTGKKLSDFFNETKNDPVGARIIINNDVAKMGKQIAGYHDKFLAALDAAQRFEPVVEPPVAFETVDIAIITTPGVTVSVTLNGQVVLSSIAD
jgi:putative chitinase